MARPGASDAELRDALARAHVLDMVDAHPQGLALRLFHIVFHSIRRRCIRNAAVASTLPHLLHRRLRTEHRGVLAVLGHEFGVGARFHTRTVVEHGNGVGVHGIGKSVRHQNDGFAFGQFMHGAHDEPLAFRVHTARGLVEDHDWRGIAYAPAPNTVEHNVKQPESVHIQRAPMTTFQLVRRLLGQVGDLRPLMVLACCFGTLGHLAATFLPVFGVMALCAAAERPVWGLSVGWAVALMAVCALIRGAMRYCEQYMNHNLAFRLLALFRRQMFAALRRLAPAKLTGKGKGAEHAIARAQLHTLAP